MKISSLVLELTLTLVCVGFCLRDALVEGFVGESPAPIAIEVVAPVLPDSSDATVWTEARAQLATSSSPDEAPPPEDLALTPADYVRGVAEL